MSEPRMEVGPGFTDCRGVIFDLDGTLIDSLADIAAAANAVLADANHPIHPIESYRTFVGDGVRTLFERALPPGLGSADLVNRCAGAFSAKYDRTWNVRTRLYDGIEAALDMLVDRGLKMSVLSNKPDAFTKMCMAHYCSRWPFQFVAGQREGVPRKPHPEGALQIARELGLEPGRLAFVGDSSVDMQTARNAGMFAIGVSWGFRSAAELWETGAQRVIDLPTELPRVLGVGD